MNNKLLQLHNTQKENRICWSSCDDSKTSLTRQISKDHEAAKKKIKEARDTFQQEFEAYSKGVNNQTSIS